MGAITFASCTQPTRDPSYAERGSGEDVWGGFAVRFAVTGNPVPVHPGSDATAASSRLGASGTHDGAGGRFRPNLRPDPTMNLMSGSLPAAQANSRLARRATAVRRAGGAALTWPERLARIYREIYGGVRTGRRVLWRGRKVGYEPFSLPFRVWHSPPSGFPPSRE